MRSYPFSLALYSPLRLRFPSFWYLSYSPSSAPSSSTSSSSSTPFVRMFLYRSPSRASPTSSKLEFWLGALPNLPSPFRSPCPLSLCSPPTPSFLPPRNRLPILTYRLSRPSTPSKSYTRAGLQGIVNCSCSANLHKSILNQPSSPRRVRRQPAANRTTDLHRCPYLPIANPAITIHILPLQNKYNSDHLFFVLYKLGSMK